MEDCQVDLCAISMRGGVKDSLTSYDGTTVVDGIEHEGINFKPHLWRLALRAAASMPGIEDAFLLRFIKSALDYSVDVLASDLPNDDHDDAKKAQSPPATDAPAEAGAGDGAPKAEQGDGEAALKPEQRSGVATDAPAAAGVAGSQEGFAVAVEAGEESCKMGESSAAATSAPTSQPAAVPAPAPETTPAAKRALDATAVAAGTARIAALHAGRAWESLPTVYKAHRMRRAIDRRFSGTPERRTRDYHLQSFFGDDGDDDDDEDSDEF
jgi:hypothetical protein